MNSKSQTKNPRPIKRKNSKDTQPDPELLKELYTNPIDVILKETNKKQRNIQKRNDRLDQIQNKISNNEKVEQDQLNALAKKPEVVAQLEFSREIIGLIESNKKMRESSWMENFQANERQSWIDSYLEANPMVPLAETELNNEQNQSSASEEKNDNHCQTEDLEQLKQDLELKIRSDLESEYAEKLDAQIQASQIDLESQLKKYKEEVEEKVEEQKEKWMEEVIEERTKMDLEKAKLEEIKVDLDNVFCLTKLQLILSMLSRHHDPKKIMLQSDLTPEEEANLAALRFFWDYRFIYK